MKSGNSLSAKAYNIIKQRVIDMQLRPGEVIMVQPLAQELGLSRTPVREALVRLHEDGLLENANGNKFKVSEIDLSKIIEIYDMREVLEGYAVRQLASNHLEEQIQDLASICNAMDKAYQESNIKAFFELDSDFHAKIIDFTKNTTLQELTSLIVDRTQRIRFLSWYVPKRLEETIDEHQKIVAQIQEKNPDGAAMALSYHLGKVKSGIRKLFENQNHSFSSWAFGFRHVL
jgi:DNA-binding GntR family transcriptional regulator